MSNMLDQDDDNFSDQNDELNGGVQEVQVVQGSPMAPPATRRFTGKPITPPAQQEVEEEPVEQDEDEEDMAVVLTDARLRLEQGRLYEMVMNHDMFSDTDSDPRAVKIVQKEIRKFAQDRMEIMLGMRQEAPKQEANAFPMDMFPFNSLEVDALKALAAAATKGASREAEPFVGGPQQPPKSQSLRPISKGSGKTTPAKQLAQRPAAPVKRPKVNDAIQRILQEEGVTLDEINRTFDRAPMTPEEFANLSAEELIERNRKARGGKQVSNPASVPMPPPEQIEAMYTARANQASMNPQMQTIMNLLNNRKPTN